MKKISAKTSESLILLCSSSPRVHRRIRIPVDEQSDVNYNDTVIEVYSDANLLLNSRGHL